VVAVVSKNGALRDLADALLHEHERDDTIPTNIRFLFYELVQRGQISKIATGARRADQDLHDAPGARVLYLGDYDLAGNQIEANTRRVLEREVGPLNWERLALTEEQVRAYDLPRIIKHDRRYKDRRPHEAVETEAISQRVLIDILRTCLDELLPEPLGRVQEHEARQRRRIAALLTTNRRRT
jgi:hypothetical protein